MKLFSMQWKVKIINPALKKYEYANFKISIHVNRVKKINKIACNKNVF